MEDSEIHVMSEIHVGCPAATIGPSLSSFTFSDHSTIGVDKDGDLLLPRRRTSNSKHLHLTFVIIIPFYFLMGERTNRPILSRVVVYCHHSAFYHINPP